jgi:hypothetical protein
MALRAKQLARLGESISGEFPIRIGVIFGIGGIHGRSAPARTEFVGKKDPRKPVRRFVHDRPGEEIDTLIECWRAQMDMLPDDANHVCFRSLA